MTQSHECASKYLIPAISPGPLQYTDPDLHYIHSHARISLCHPRIHSHFPRFGTTADARSLWISDLFVDLIRVGPTLTPRSYGSYLSAAVADHRPTIANDLHVRYMLLGGHIENEILWAADKSYAAVSSSFLSAYLLPSIPAIHRKPSSLTCRQE